MNQEARKKCPNIIYFNPDELRANVLGCYGYALKGVTPNIDNFAAEAVRFKQCHVQSTVCSPSRCSFMTGTYAHNRGHRSLWHLLREEEPNTLKYLKNNGYDVHTFGKNDLLSPEAKDASITQIHEIHKDVKQKNLYQLDEDGYFSFLYQPLTEPPNDFYKMQAVIEFLQHRPKDAKPYMLYLPFLLPHCPYTIHEPWYSKYSPQDVPELLPVRKKGAPTYMEQIRKTRRLDKLDEGHFRKIMAVYLGMVSYMDHLFGMLLNSLKATNQADNTAIFFFSDHGDWAGDYGLVEKWPNGMDDRLTHVPLLIKTPNSKLGHVVPEQVECFDIMPTSLEIAGIEASHSHSARSLVPQLQGSSGDPERAVYCEGGYNLPADQVCFEFFPGYPDQEGYIASPAITESSHIYGPKSQLQKDLPHTVCRSTMIRTLRYKLIIRSMDINELYDLEKDHGELLNLYEEVSYREIRQELEQRMLTWYITTADTTPWDRDPRNWT